MKKMILAMLAFTGSMIMALSVRGDIGEFSDADGVWVKVPDTIGSAVGDVQSYADGVCKGLSLISVKSGSGNPLSQADRARIVKSVTARHGYMWVPRKASTALGRVEEALGKVGKLAGAVKNSYNIGKIIGIAAGSESIDAAVDTFVSEGMIQDSVAGEAGYWMGTIVAGVANGKSVTEAIVEGYDEKNVGKISKAGFKAPQWMVRFATDMPDKEETLDDIYNRVKYEHETKLEQPKIGLIQDIGPYKETVDMLGFTNDKGPYLILLEDYHFKDYAGNEYTIPAGFIFDGTSLPTWRDNGLLGFVTQVAMPDQTKYSSPAEGLIHDYMYRHPEQFSKEESDQLFSSNLKITGNPRASMLYKGVRYGAGSAYNEHKKNSESGKYKFTDDYYRHNVEIWRNSQGNGGSPLDEQPEGEGDSQGSDTFKGVTPFKAY